MRKRTFKNKKHKGGDCCRFEKEGMRGDCPGGGSRQNESNNLYVYLGNWQLRNREEVRIGITRHAYKHMDTIGINCYNTMELVNWLKQNLETARIFKKPFATGENFGDFLSRQRNFTKPMSELSFEAYQPNPILPPNVDPGSVVKYRILFNCFHRGPSHDLISEECVGQARSFAAGDPQRLITIFQVVKLTDKGIPVYDCNFNDEHFIGDKPCPVLNALPPAQLTIEDEEEKYWMPGHAGGSKKISTRKTSKRRQNRLNNIRR
jgi:hypothetical protein